MNFTEFLAKNHCIHSSSFPKLGDFQMDLAFRLSALDVHRRKLVLLTEHVKTNQPKSHDSRHSNQANIHFDSKIEILEHYFWYGRFIMIDSTNGGSMTSLSIKTA